MFDSIALTTEMIVIIIVLILIPILIWLIRKWILKARENKGIKILSENSVSKGYLPKSAPKKQGQKPYTLDKGKSIEVAKDIKECINTFSADDIVSILSIMKNNIKTKTDLAMVDAQLELNDIRIYDVINKGLKSLDQKKLFSKWINDLPDYV